MQIEPISDSSSHDVAEQTRKRIFLPGDITFGDTIHNIVGHIVSNPGILQGLSPLGMSESGTKRDDHFERPGHTENTSHPRTVKRTARSVACVLESSLGTDHSQQLRRINRFQIIGRNTEFERIKRER